MSTRQSYPPAWASLVRIFIIKNDAPEYTINVFGATKKIRVPPHQNKMSGHLENTRLIFDPFGCPIVPSSVFCRNWTTAWRHKAARSEPMAPKLDAKEAHMDAKAPKCNQKMPTWSPKVPNWSPGDLKVSSEHPKCFAELHVAFSTLINASAT